MNAEKNLNKNKERWPQYEELSSDHFYWHKPSSQHNNPVWMIPRFELESLHQLLMETWFYLFGRWKVSVDLGGSWWILVDLGDVLMCWSEELNVTMGCQTADHSVHVEQSVSVSSGFRDRTTSSCSQQELCEASRGQCWLGTGSDGWHVLFNPLSLFTII